MNAATPATAGVEVDIGDRRDILPLVDIADRVGGEAVVYPERIGKRHAISFQTSRSRSSTHPTLIRFFAP